jgi:uncharacterized membrane protein YdjX (TVP38/TMEM64 family)
MKHKHCLLAGIIISVIIVAIIIATYFIPGIDNFSSPTYIREFLLNLGWIGYFVYVILVIASIPLPIPSTPIVFAGGYVYGTLVGSVLAVIATVLGAAISFYVVRKLGEPVLELLMDKRHIDHFSHLFKKRGVSIALISYIVPVFPADIVGLLMGLTKIRFHTFLAVVIVGSIPRSYVLNALGSDLYTGLTTKTVFLIGLVVVCVVMAIFREWLKKLMFRELRELEHGTKTLEKEVEKEIGISETKEKATKKRKVRKRK